MKGTFKRLGAFTLAVVILLPAGFGARVRASESMLYEEKKTQTVTSGVLYDEVTRMYDRGWLRFFALRIDLKNPNVRLDILENTDELGVKSTVGELARVHNSVAAINGDFFGSTPLSTSMGIVIEDGGLKETRNYYNADKPTYAGLYIDKNNNPFIDYLKVTYIGFLTNGTSKLEIDGKNKVTDMKKPVYIDRRGMADTSKLDARFKDLYKIVVQGDRIVDISAKGAVKAVPENGFLIVMNGPTAVEHLKNFAVGDEAKYTETYQFLGNSALRASDIKLGISGGSKILENGETRDNGLIIEAQKRHPRTAAGINKEKTELILIAIDGRSGDSIGATHWETAEILREYGAWDAFHLDGGGSTTLIARNEGDTALTLQNAPSDGSQRRIPNAVGVASVNAPGSLAGLYVYANGKREGAIAMATQPVTLTVKGYDSNYNPVEVSGAAFTQEGARGIIEGNTFTPQEEGETVITAEAGGLTASVSVRGLSRPTALRITPRAFTLNPGDSLQLKAELINKDGYGIDITSSAPVWSVTGGIGYFEGAGVFKAGADGTGSVSVSYGGYIGSAWASVGSYIETLLDFETADSVAFSGVDGQAAYTNAIKHGGQHSLQINYAFKADSASAQTAVVDFTNARASITKPPNAFGFFMTGDAAGSTVTAAFTDGAGNEHVYGFPAKMDNGDWKYYYQRFPTEGLPLPLKLKNITITSAENLKTPVNAKVYLDTFQVSYDHRPDEAALKTDIYGDYMQQDLGATAYGEGYSPGTELTVFGPTASAKSQSELDALNRVVMKMQQNSRLAIFAGYTAALPQMAVEALKWPDAYGVKDLPDVRVITLGTSKGGLRQTSPQQWKSLAADLESSPSKNVVLVLNKDIWDKNYGFADNKERDLLHKTLKEFREKTGANVIVAAGASTETKGYVIDGIRYITLNGLSSADTSAGYNMLRIMVNGSTMRYDLEAID